MPPTKSRTDLDPTLAYILLVLTTVGPIKADYQTIAKQAGLAGPRAAQKKLKREIERCGYALVDGVVVSFDGTKPGEGTAKRPGASGKRKAAGGDFDANKRRKQDAEETEGLSMGAEDESIVKDENGRDEDDDEDAEA